MIYKSEAIKNWRKRLKAKIIDAMGSGCNNCGYNTCSAALVLHHIDPNEKDFSIASLRANIRSIEVIITELKKCVLLCANCHTEVHHNGLIITQRIFDETKLKPNKKKTYCIVCGKLKLNCNKTCSVECSGKSRRKVDWDNINLIELIKNEGSNAKAAKYLGISENAVKKRLKKLNVA